MTLAQSIRSARAALESGVDRYRLSCLCGWECEETRPHVESRIHRHFDWPDARSNEIVLVEPIEATNQIGD